MSKLVKALTNISDYLPIAKDLVERNDFFWKFFKTFIGGFSVLIIDARVKSIIDVTI